MVLIALVASSAFAARGASECLGGWRAAGADRGARDARMSCRDGDPACDADGVADGTCRITVAYCLNLPGCAPGALGSIELRGTASAALAGQAAALAYPVTAPGVCTASAEIAVSAGRGRRRVTTLRARVRDLASSRRDADRLALACRGGGTGGGRAVVVGTDFETGELSAVRTTPPRRAARLEARVHSDAVVRTSGGMVFVLNRFLGDNVQRLDPTRGLRTRFQCSTGPASNPHDIAVVAPDKAYLTRYDRPELWIVDPSVTDCARFRRGTIDLAGFADGDGLPEMSQLAVAAGQLFVSVQRLDRRRGFTATGPSRLVVIDLATDTVAGEVVLHGANAFGDGSGIAREPGSGHLVVSSAGDIYRVGDGGLERIDPATRTAEGRFFVDERAVGGNILDFVLLSPRQGYAVVQDAGLRNHLVAFDPGGERPARPIYSRTAFLPDLALGPDGLLWLADQGLPDPGIRLFDPATDRPVRHGRLRLGLPPFSIGFVP